MSDLPPFELGHPRTELRRQLVDAVLRGEKIATAGLLEEYDAEGEQPEPVGSRCTLLGYDDEPVAVIEVTESRVVPAADIDQRFARGTLAAVGRQGFFEPQVVERLLADHVAGREDRSRQLWGLLAFTLWYERHVEQEPPRLRSARMEALAA